ncbi:MAG: hypothetical protein NTV30_03365 [Chloroflexi bacterium]|nr:hypothetical protein [Chloroflexota bacterium]
MFIGVIGGNNCTPEEAIITDTVGREIAFTFTYSIPVIGINSLCPDKNKMKTGDCILSFKDPIKAVEKAINLIKDK